MNVFNVARKYPGMVDDLLFVSKSLRVRVLCVQRSLIPLFIFHPLLFTSNKFSEARHQNIFLRFVNLWWSDDRIVFMILSEGFEGFDRELVYYHN